MRYGSATSTFLVMAACLPLNNWLLANRAIMGSQVGSTSVFTFIGLGVIVAGLVLYGMGSSKSKSKDPPADDFLDTSAIFDEADVLASGVVSSNVNTVGE